MIYDCTMKEIKKFKLPFMSVSVNNAFRWWGEWKRRYKTKDYSDFEWRVFSFFRDNHKSIWNIEWDNWLKVSYKYYFNIYNKDWSKKIKDTWNYEKTLTDRLSGHIKWFEDHKIKVLVQEKEQSEDEFIEVEIEEIES